MKASHFTEVVIPGVGLRAVRERCGGLGSSCSSQPPSLADKPGENRWLQRYAQLQPVVSQRACGSSKNSCALPSSFLPGREWPLKLFSLDRLPTRHPHLHFHKGREKKSPCAGPGALPHPQLPASLQKPTAPQICPLTHKACPDARVLTVRSGLHIGLRRGTAVFASILGQGVLLQPSKSSPAAHSA